MARTLRVKNWAKHFETHETKRWKTLRWVPISNNQSDPGYVRLVAHENGPGMFGVWIGLIQLASHQKVRGEFREGDGTPYEIGTLASVMRMPKELVEETVTFLTTEVVWLEWVSDPSGDVQPAVAVTQRAEARLNRPDQNGTEQNSDLKELIVSESQEQAYSWSQYAAAMRKLLPLLRPRSRADREFVAKVCYLACIGAYPEYRLWDAKEGLEVELRKKPIANRAGYLRSTLVNNLRSNNKIELEPLIAGVKLPEDWDVPASEPRMMGAEP